MILQHPTYQPCPCCSQEKEVSPAIIKCDECGNHFPESLDIHIEQDGKLTTKEFCSWDCLFTHLPKVTADTIILPSLDFKEERKGMTAGEFFGAVNQFKTQI